jgi:hypothetical protein
MVRKLRGPMSPTTPCVLMSRTRNGDSCPIMGDAARPTRHKRVPAEDTQAWGFNRTLILAP